MGIILNFTHVYIYTWYWHFKKLLAWKFGCLEGRYLMVWVFKFSPDDLLAKINFGNTLYWASQANQNVTWLALSACKFERVYETKYNTRTRLSEFLYLSFSHHRWFFWDTLHAVFMLAVAFIGFCQLQNTSYSSLNTGTTAHLASSSSINIDTSYNIYTLSLYEIKLFQAASVGRLGSKSSQCVGFVIYPTPFDARGRHPAMVK